MITKERIKEIYAEELKNPSQVVLTQDLKDLCMLALKGLAASKLEKTCEFYGDENNWIIRKYGSASACEYYSYKDQISGADTDLDHFETRKKRTIAGKTARTTLTEYRKETSHE